MADRPTMTDVARRAGVSRALVSIVFRDVPGASAETRVRVRAAAEELGYRPDRRARLLSRRRTQVLGVAFALGHEFHADLLAGLYRAAAAHDQDLALSGTTADRDEGEAVADLLALRCDALLLLGSGLSDGRARPARDVGAHRRRRAGHHQRRGGRGPHRRRHRGRAGCGAPGRARAHPARARRGAVRPPAPTNVATGSRRRSRRPGWGRRHRARRADRGRRGCRGRRLLAREVTPTGLAVFNDQSAVGLMDVLQQAGLRWPETSAWSATTTARSPARGGPAWRDDGAPGRRRAGGARRPPCGRTGRRTRPARAAGPGRPEPPPPGQHGTPASLNLGRRGKVGVMDYTHLGRTGLASRRLCLGTMNFGPQTDEPDSHAIMDAAHEHGINFFDTANVYGRARATGWTEEIIGRWFARAAAAASGPCSPPSCTATWATGRTTASCPRSTSGAPCDASLQRLQTDYIDLYQFHHVDRDTPWDEIWQAIEVAVQQGKILYVGSSNFAGWHIAQAQEAAARRATSSAWSASSRSTTCSTREVELEVLPAAAALRPRRHPVVPAAGRPARRRDPRSEEGVRRLEGRAARRWRSTATQIEAVRGPRRRARPRAGRRGPRLAAAPAGGHRARSSARGRRSSWTAPSRAWTRARRGRAEPARRDLPRAPDGARGLRLVSRPGSR